MSVPGQTRFEKASSFKVNESGYSVNKMKQHLLLWLLLSLETGILCRIQI